MTYKPLALGKSIALGVAAGAALLATAPIAPLHASSHMDAPLITFDDPANTTDVYAFVSQSEDGVTPYLTTALAVYPFEEPGIGPNNYRFDDRVRYEIHVGLGRDVETGSSSITYRFDFETEFANPNTILQSYLGEVAPVDPTVEPVRDRFDANQNMRQFYTVTMIDNRSGEKTVLGQGIVPPNNQGRVTRFYNQGEDGDNPAIEGQAREIDLDGYTRQAIAELASGYRSFAGQRDDGFYADIQSIFDLDFSFGRGFDSPRKPFDSQGGFNVHTIVLNIPLSELGNAQIAGVHATTSRRRVTKLAKNPGRRDYDDDDEDRSDRRGRLERASGRFVQVGRQGNPLFAEALIANVDKDLYNRTKPTQDDRLFGRYADDPELSAVLNLTPAVEGLLRAIYVPDVIKVDLTTGPARLAGESDFRRLSIFGGDLLQSQFQDPFGNGGFIPGGWPNGRRFGDDVLDIALIAVGVLGVLGQDFNIPVDETANLFDGVTENDITFNDVFPYAATPLNARNHGHHGVPAETL